MSNPFEAHLEAVLQYLAGLEHPAEGLAAAIPGSLLLPAETRANLITALKELAGAAEALRQENEALAVANEGLEEELARYQNLFELAPDGYLVTDFEGVILEINHAATVLFRRERRFLRNKPLVLFVLSEDRPQFHIRLTGFQKDKLERTEKWELRLQPHEGLPFQAALTVAVVRNIFGQSDALCWVVRDVTARKQAEEALRQARDELEIRVQERTAELTRAIAALEAEITERRRIDEEKSHLLEVLQQQQQQLRALAGQLAEVQESERKQLARELHDRVGQSLTALGLNLNMIGAYMTQNLSEDGSMQMHVADSLALVDQTTESIRDVMAHLRPPVLDDYGLVAALRWYGNQVAARANFIVTVQGEEPAPRLAAPVEHALFRIAQEALINATKHAQASHVVISLETDKDTVCLTIRDDGIGFEAALPAGAGQRQGWGLISMAERAEAVDGHCRVESIPGDGTQVIVEAPR